MSIPWIHAGPVDNSAPLCGSFAYGESCQPTISEVTCLACLRLGWSSAAGNADRAWKRAAEAVDAAQAMKKLLDEAFAMVASLQETLRSTYQMALDTQALARKAIEMPSPVPSPPRQRHEQQGEQAAGTRRQP